MFEVQDKIIVNEESQTIHILNEIKASEYNGILRDLWKEHLVLLKYPFPHIYTAGIVEEIDKENNIVRLGTILLTSNKWNITGLNLLQGVDKLGLMED